MLSAASSTDWTMSRGRSAPRRSILQARDWAVLGGLVGAIAAGLWLARRWSVAGEGIEVDRSITVDAPVERVYEFWNDFENFPRFMSHVHEVRRTGPDRTHWVVAGPGGTPISVTPSSPVGHQPGVGWRRSRARGLSQRHRAFSRSASSDPVMYDEIAPWGESRPRLATLFGITERVIADDLDAGHAAARPRAAGEAGPAALSSDVVRWRQSGPHCAKTSQGAFQRFTRRRERRVVVMWRRSPDYGCRRARCALEIATILNLRCSPSSAIRIRVGARR